MSHADEKIHLSPNHFLETLILSCICVHFGILTDTAHDGCGTDTSRPRTRSYILIGAETYKSSPLRVYMSDGLICICI